MKVKCFSEDKNKVHLTFDDGPDPETTPQILDILKKNNVKAKFFCIGKKIEQQPELTKRIFEDGHTLGNHSYSHSNFFPLFKTKRVKKELKKTNELLKNITGNDCNIFRPPFGVTNPNIARAIRKLDMQTIGWSIRTLDTVAEKEIVLEKMWNAKPGDIILLHDTKTQTVEILKEYFRMTTRD